MRSQDVHNAREANGDLLSDCLKTGFTFSIITATYSRAHLLERVFRSLEAQTFRDFEWIVVDDGSPDDTEEIVRRLSDGASFPIRYLKKDNGGKISAVNHGMTVARGFFIGVQDDDDWYCPEAMERCWTRWLEIPEEKRDEYVGLAALASYPDGRIVGTRFSKEILDSDSIDIRCVHHAVGDHKSFLRAEVFRQYPFPEDIGGIPESLVWNRIALRYKTRFVDEIWSYIEYLPDGMSARFHLRKGSDALGMWLCAKELLCSGRKLPFGFAIHTQANFIRYRLHNRAFDLASIREVLSPTFPIGAVLGVAVFVWDKAEPIARRWRSFGATEIATKKRQRLNA